ncbi:MAG: tetratricopeptide repeat protein [Candidatus Hydrogenedentota bacterium]
MPTLSVVMIVKNEAECLGKCLASVRDIADELVIGDTGSTDQTVAVAERFHARVFEIPWRDDFAWARNRVLEAATGDWLLHLDADEVLDAQGAAQIRAVVDADGAGADAIEVTLANYCDDPRSWRWVAVAPDDPMARGHAGYVGAPLLRLFRNKQGFEYREPVHENITESVVERGGVVRAEPILIHHYGYQAGDARSDAKKAFYLELNRKKTEERPDDPKAWHDYAEQALVCGDAAAAEAATRRALELEPLHLGAATTLANILLNRGDLEEAQVLLMRMEAAGVTAPHVHTALGAIACRIGRLEDARQRLESVLTAAPGSVMARLYLARVYDRLGDFSAARGLLEKGCALTPAIEELQHRLEAHRLREGGEQAFAAGNLERAARDLIAALKLDPDDPFIHNDLGVVSHALGQVDRARTSFERALKLAPGLPEALENFQLLTNR